MKQAVILMDYPGCVISVNHYKFKNRYTKPEAKDWGDELGWRVKPLHLEDWNLPLEVTCNGVFLNKRSAPDLHNLAKLTMDSLQEASGVNDRDMRWHDGTRTIDKYHLPIIELVIEESE